MKRIGVLALWMALTLSLSLYGLVAQAWAGGTSTAVSTAYPVAVLPSLPNPFVAIGQGLKKIGDGIASLVPKKSPEPETSRYYPPGSVKKPAEKKSLFGRPKEPPKKVESVYDWMGQEQVLP